MKKIVVFGAGATGRGHVGLLAWQAGYHIVFVEKRRELVDLLTEAGKYRVRLFGGNCPADQYQEVEVHGFLVLPAEDRTAVAEEVSSAALVLTAVFDQNLSDVAVTLARAVELCRSRKRTQPLNVIACENMMDSSSTLGKHVKGLLDGAGKQYQDEVFGFPDCMISRVVPRPEADPLLILTEDYNEWTVNRQAYKGAKPDDLSAIELVDNQKARLERKLFIHNGGHAVCGYVGFQRGCQFIHEAVAEPVVLTHVLGALGELGKVVQTRWGFSQESIQDYAADLGRRGSVAELRDEVLRVVRDPIRKLSAHERLVAPALLAVEYGLPRQWIVRGICAALRYHHAGDAQSLKLGKMIDDHGLEAVLGEVCGIPKGSPLLDEITTTYETWSFAE